MHRSLGVIGLAAVLTAACGASVNVEQERTALLQRDRDWSQAATDPDRFASFFAADASFNPPGMPPVTGADAIRKVHAEAVASPGFSVQWTPSRADVSAAGDLGYTIGTYTSAMGGAKETGKYVTTWRKEAGTWKVTSDTFNPNGPSVPEHAMVAPAAITWGDAPPSLPAGARAAVISGDPAQPGPFVLRVQVPSGYRIPTHWHPTTENVTVLSGTIALAMGESPDPKAFTDLAAGGYAVLPAEMRHTFQARTAATVQVHGIGPFAITYVNPADDPRQQPKK
jgi:ketosteroid isomerase-like protein